MFHRECLLMYLNDKIDRKDFPILCPEEKCKKEMIVSDIQELLPKEKMEKFSEFAFSNFIDSKNDSSWCPTADCKYVFLFDDKNGNFQCPICNENYCLNCRVIYHKGMNCK